MSHISILELRQLSQKTLDYLHEEFRGLQLGRASAGLVENISIDSYGSKQPLKNLANIGVDGPQSLTISPWDKKLLSQIEKIIREDSILGLSPINDGIIIRLNIPSLTIERRKDLTKIVSKMGEAAKVSLRKQRHSALESLKKSELSEDEEKSIEKEIQKEIDEMNKKIEEAVKTKQEEILKV